MEIITEENVESQTKKVNPPNILSGGSTITKDRIDNKKAPSRLLQKDVRNVLAGVDTLYIGFGLPLDLDVISELEGLKQEAQELTPEGLKRVVLYQVNGIKFIVAPYGKPRYAFRLENADYVIYVSKTSEVPYPPVYVEIRSVKLWSESLEKIMIELKDLVYEGFVDKGMKRQVENVVQDKVAFGQVAKEYAKKKLIVEKVSRVDVCADFVNTNIDKDTFWQIVTKAKDRSLYVTGSTEKGMNGMSFGKGKVMARIYNKTKEIERSKKTWFYELWNIPEGSKVWRVEFQLRRNFLKEWKIESIVDLKKVLPDIWQYLTYDWLSIRQQDDINTTRRSLTKLWQVVQSVKDFFGTVSGAVRNLSRHAKVEHLTSMIRGCLETVGALRSKVLNMESLGFDAVIGFVKELVAYQLSGISAEGSLKQTIVDLNFRRHVLEKAVAY